VEVPGGPEGEERIFFFEKRSKKLFPVWCLARATDGALGRRVLLLFFKKEALSQAFAIS
jgi:hypothetical protein